jgi:hypothetical protein
MQEINLDQFEMTNESMSKVLGGQQCTTNGVYNATQDKWCVRDSGIPGDGALNFSNCHALNDDGTWAD